MFKTSAPHPAGVDLALIFQDNAGCTDMCIVQG